MKQVEHNTMFRHEISERDLLRFDIDFFLEDEREPDAPCTACGCLEAHFKANARSRSSATPTCDSASLKVRCGLYCAKEHRVAGFDILLRPVKFGSACCISRKFLGANAVVFPGWMSSAKLSSYASVEFQKNLEDLRCEKQELRRGAGREAKVIPRGMNQKNAGNVLLPRFSGNKYSYKKLFGRKSGSCDFSLAIRGNRSNSIREIPATGSASKDADLGNVERG